MKLDLLAKLLQSLLPYKSGPLISNGKQTFANNNFPLLTTEKVIKQQS